jgi:hypothetical protein
MESKSLGYSQEVVIPNSYPADAEELNVADNGAGQE